MTEVTPLNVLLVITLAYVCVFSVILSPLWVPPLYRKVMEYWPLPAAKNTVTGNTPKQRVREHLCRLQGCITYSRGYYHGLPQATCARCGHKNRCAQPQVKEWRAPD